MNLAMIIVEIKGMKHFDLLKLRVSVSEGMELIMARVQLSSDQQVCDISQFWGSWVCKTQAIALSVRALSTLSCNVVIAQVLSAWSDDEYSSVLMVKQ